MKIAVYTSITGNYDELKQPLFTDPDFDYICFIDASVAPGRDGVWEVRPCGYGGNNPRLASRWAKLLPHKALKGYDASLWIDGNIQISDPQIYDVIRTKFSEGVLYAGIANPLRNCIYDEARDCFRTGKIGFFSWLWTFIRLKAHGYPRHTGLMENSVIFRRHGDKRIVRMDRLWWKWLRFGPHLDRLSFMYCLDRYRVMRDYLLPRKSDVRNHPAFKCSEHPACSGGMSAGHPEQA